MTFLFVLVASLLGDEGSLPLPGGTAPSNESGIQSGHGSGARFGFLRAAVDPRRIPGCGTNRAVRENVKETHGRNMDKPRH